MKTPKVWKNGPPDPDWDEKINHLRGLELKGAHIEKDGSVVTFEFAQGRWFSLRGDGQRHSYEVSGDVAGTFERVDVIKCVRVSESPCVSKYIARFTTSGGTFDMTVTRETETPPAEGFRFSLKAERRQGKPAKDKKKPELPFRI